GRGIPLLSRKDRGKSGYDSLLRAGHPGQRVGAYAHGIASGAAEGDTHARRFAGDSVGIWLDAEPSWSAGLVRCRPCAGEVRGAESAEAGPAAGDDAALSAVPH